MDKRDLIDFLKAETEEKITELIQEKGMDNREDWQPYGNQNNNYTVIFGQASSAEKAYIEKVTNSIDALLMRKCYEKGIDPKSEEAPNTVKEALKLFYDIETDESGRLKIDKEKQNKIQNDLYIMSTSKDCKTIRKLGRNAHVNMLLYDGGEGQSPKNLPDTILSLLKDNKKGIPFTQGNYNQGGSSALMFCGEKGYSLIISRRHPNIDSKFNDPNDKTIDEWGWTLIRRETRPNTNDPIFTYYAPNGEVPHFQADSLPLKPEILKGEKAKEYLDYDNFCSAGIPYKQEVEYGTLIKLYDYDLNKKGPLLSHFKYELGRGILDTYLPMKVVDCRKNKWNNISTFRGLQKVIDDDLKTNKNNLINKKFPITNTYMIDEYKQKVKITVYGFNERKNSKKNAKSLTGGSNPIKVVLGQQFQGSFSKAYISNSGLSILKDSLLIIIQFPDIGPEFKGDLFMTDRERIADKKPKKEIKKRLKSFLKQNETLKEFASKKMEELMDQDVKENEDIKSTVEQWLKDNPEVEHMLQIGDWLPSDKGNSEGGSKKGKPTRDKTDDNPDTTPIETQTIPNYFKPAHRCKDGQYYTRVTQDKKLTIRFKTDAEEDFFDREEMQGNVIVERNGKHTDKYSCTINKGKANFYFVDKFTKKTGEFKLDFRVTCEEANIEFEYEIKVYVKEEQKEPDDQNQGYNGLPDFREIYKEDKKWEEYNLTIETGAIFRSLDDKEIYLINMDNKYLQNKLENTSLTGDKKYYKNLYRACMLLSGMAAKNEAKQNEDKMEENYETVEEAIEEEVKLSTRSTARTIFVVDKLITDMRDRIGQIA